MPDRAGWNPQAWRGYPERVGQWWRLTKGSRAVVCDIYTYPLGGELRCEIDGEMLRETSAATEGSLLCAGTSTRCAEWRP